MTLSHSEQEEYIRQLEASHHVMLQKMHEAEARLKRIEAHAANGKKQLEMAIDALTKHGFIENEDGSFSPADITSQTALIAILNDKNAEIKTLKERNRSLGKSVEFYKKNQDKFESVVNLIEALTNGHLVCD